MVKIKLDFDNTLNSLIFFDYCVFSHLFISTNLFHLKAHLITNFLLIHPQTKFHSDEQFFGISLYSDALVVVIVSFTFSHTWNGKGKPFRVILNSFQICSVFDQLVPSYDFSFTLNASGPIWIFYLGLREYMNDWKNEYLNLAIHCNYDFFFLRVSQSIHSWH